MILRGNGFILRHLRKNKYKNGEYIDDMVCQG